MDTRQLQQSNSWVVITTVLVLTPITTMFVAARIYSCHVILRRRFYTEEWLSVISLTFLWLGAAFATKLFLSGGGHHWVLLTEAERTRTRFWYWMWTLTAGFVLSVPNLAIVSLLCRLFSPRRWHTVVLWSIAVICNINFVFGLIMQMFRCKPLRVPWDASAMRGGECWDQWVYIKYCLYAAVYSAAADLCLAVYPALILRQLAWSRKKIALGMMLGLSIIAAGIACYKTTLLQHIASDDFSYEISYLVIWTMTEGYVMLIASCVPALQPWYDKVTARPNDTAQRCRPSYSHRRAHSPCEHGNQSVWSALKPSFRSYTPSFAGSRRRNFKGGRTASRTRDTAEFASPRTLEDAANLAYPPATIWKQTVRVGHHSRIRSQDHESF